jgi:hypothetical protein
MAININEFAAKEKTWRVKRQGATIPFGGVFAHYSHDYGGLPHSRTDHISIEPLNVDSVPPHPHKPKAYGFRSSRINQVHKKPREPDCQVNFLPEMDTLQLSHSQDEEHPPEMQAS